MEYNSGSNRASNFKSREADLKLRAYYQLISSIFLFQLKLDSLPGHNFFSLILIGYHVPCSEISLASGICYLIFIGSLTVRFDLSDYKLPVIGQVKSDSFGVT